MNRMYKSLTMIALFLTLVPTVLASNTWYVNGVNGNNSADCKTPTTACKTIGHAISLASSGDSVIVAAATYSENLTIGISLNVIGSGSNTTIIDGGGVNGVVTIPNGSVQVTLSNVTIRHGFARYGGGLFNSGTLTIIASTISGNKASTPSTCFFGCGAGGGGISNSGTLYISESTVTGNVAYTQREKTGASGGGISNSGTLNINNTTVSGNSASAQGAYGGGIVNSGTVIVNNSTITANAARGIAYASGGGGISNTGNLAINNSTVSGNSGPSGGGIQNFPGMGGIATEQTTIVANNPNGGNCSGTMTSKGYNLSSDGTCNFNSRGDLNNHDPLLGPLQSNGGPTETMALLPGSPAIDGVSWFSLKWRRTSSR